MTGQLASQGSGWSNQNPGLRWARPSLHCQRGEIFCCHWKFSDKSQQKGQVGKKNHMIADNKIPTSTRVLRKCLPWIVQVFVFQGDLSDRFIWHGFFSTSWNHGIVGIKASPWCGNKAQPFLTIEMWWIHLDVSGSKCFVIGLHSWKLTAGTWESPRNEKEKQSSIRLQFLAPAVGFWVWKNNPLSNLGSLVGLLIMHPDFWAETIHLLMEDFCLHQLMRRISHFGGRLS